MTITTLRAKIGEARQKVSESAATTDSATRQFKKTPTVFRVPKDGINAGQLQYELRNRGGYNVEIEDSGDNFLVSSINPTVVATILKTLGLKATIDGDVVDLLAAATSTNQDDQSELGSEDKGVQKLGESFIRKLIGWRKVTG